MTHSTKRPPDDPPVPPATKVRPSRQMPASSSSQFQPSNHLGGDTQPSVTPNATPQPATVAPSVSNAQNAPKKPKDVAVPDDFDDDEPDPDAGPSGHNGPPVLPLEGDEPFNPAPMPDDNPTPDESPAQEEEEEETDDTIPYGSTDTDETLDYNDLVIDDSQWCLLSQEQKLCSNTASFSVPRMIDGSLVAVGSIPPRRSLHLDPPIGFPALSSCKHPAKVAFQSAAGAKGFHDKATLWVFDKPMVVRLFQGHSLAATCMKLRHCEQKRQLGILIRTMFLRNKYRTQDKVQYTHTHICRVMLLRQMLLRQVG